MRFQNTLIFLFFVFSTMPLPAQNQRARDLGIQIGVFSPGKLNAITDVPGVRVGHSTVIKGDGVRTGATAILPHSGNVFQDKIPAAIYIGNGFGKLAGYSQIEELGNLETPVVLTNTLSVPVAVQALMQYTLSLQGNESVRSVNPVVGETNDGRLNDIRGMHITKKHVLEAIDDAGSGSVEEGNVGAGTGTVCFGYKGGIGTSSRVLPEDLGGFVVGVLVQTNFGGNLTIDGVAVGEALGRYPFQQSIEDNPDGSCMIVVLTDAPVTARNLKRLAKRAMLGLGRTGGIASNGSGDYVIAASVNESVRIPYESKGRYIDTRELTNEAMTPLFMAVIEATEEAIINSLFAAKDMKGYRGAEVKALPVDRVLEILGKRE